MKSLHPLMDWTPSGNPVSPAAYQLYLPQTAAPTVRETPLKTACKRQTAALTDVLLHHFK